MVKHADIPFSRLTIAAEWHWLASAFHTATACSLLRNPLRRAQTACQLTKQGDFKLALAAASGTRFSG